MNISISKTNTQTLLTSGNERGNMKANSQCKSFPNRPDLGILLSVHYSDYDSHSWALSWIMEYCY